MEWGKKIDFLKGLEDSGQEVLALKNRPFLTTWTLSYYRAFRVLQDSRPSGMGIGMIPLSEMVAYCDLYAITDLDERDRFVTMMKALDEAYVGFLNEKRDAKNAAKSKVGSPTLAGKPRGRLGRRG